MRCTCQALVEILHRYSQVGNRFLEIGDPIKELEEAKTARVIILFPHPSLRNNEWGGGECQGHV